MLCTSPEAPILLLKLQVQSYYVTYSRSIASEGQVRASKQPGQDPSQPCLAAHSKQPHFGNLSRQMKSLFSLFQFPEGKLMFFQDYGEVGGGKFWHIQIPSFMQPATQTFSTGLGFCFVFSCFQPDFTPCSLNCCGHQSFSPSENHTLPFISDPSAT